MAEPVLPNFFMVGTGKAGSTSLYHYLKQHPQIYMSPVKEPSYFASEVHPDNLAESHLRHLARMSRRLDGRFRRDWPGKPYGWLIKEWDDYVRLFQDVQGETAVGEASVVYLWSETAAGNIASRVPDAKIIMMLRDPAERAFSQYMHQLTFGLIHGSFREHIDNCLNNRDPKISVYHPLLEVGLYHDQVRRFMDRFPAQNIRIYWYEEAWKQPKRFLKDLFEFLGVAATFDPDLTRRSLVRRAPRFAAVNYAAKQFEVTHWIRERIPDAVRPAMRRLFFRRENLKMDSKDRRYLIDYYRDDVMKLSSLVNRDLSAWLA